MLSAHQTLKDGKLPGRWQPLEQACEEATGFQHFRNLKAECRESRYEHDIWMFPNCSSQLIGMK